MLNDNPDTTGDTFRVSNQTSLGGSVPLTGPNLDGLFALVLAVQLRDHSGMVFNSDALPSNLALSSFDEPRLRILFSGGGTNQREFATGPLTYLSTTPPIPEPSTTAMLALGLGALAFMRRRQSC